MTYARKTLSEIKLIHGNYGNFIKGQKLPKDKEKKYKTPPYQDLAASTELEGETLDEKCWPGYEKKGMKTMFGKRYPNCVKKKKTKKEEFSDWRSELEQIEEKKMTKAQIKKRDEIADAISTKDMKDRYGDKNVKYAIATKLAMKEGLDDDDKPFVKKLVGKLRKGSKTHAKQADDLEKALKEEPLTKQSLDARKKAQKNVEDKMNQQDSISTVNRKNGKMTSMSFTGGSRKDLLAKQLKKADIGVKMDADGLVPNAGAVVQKQAEYGMNLGRKTMKDNPSKITDKQRKDFKVADNYLKSGNIERDINRKIPGTQQYRLDIGADEVNLGAQKYKPKKNKGFKFGIQKEDITDEALTIQDWNVDDIKFTEIETIDIIKAKPLKENKAKIIGKGLKMLGNLSKKTKIKSISPKPVATPGTTFATGGKFPPGTFSNVPDYAGALPKATKTGGQMYSTTYDLGTRISPGAIKPTKGAFKGGGSLKGRIDPSTGDRVSFKQYKEIMKERGKKYYEPVKGAKFGDKIMATNRKAFEPAIKQEKLPLPKPRKEPKFKVRDDATFGDQIMVRKNEPFSRNFTGRTPMPKPSGKAKYEVGKKGVDEFTGGDMYSKVGFRSFKDKKYGFPGLKKPASAPKDASRLYEPKGYRDYTPKRDMPTTNPEAGRVLFGKGELKTGVKKKGKTIYKENIDLEEGIKRKIVKKLVNKVIKKIKKEPVKYSVDKALSQKVQLQSIKNQAKYPSQFGKQINKGNTPVKVDLSKPINFDKYIGTTKPKKSIKKFGSERPTGTFTDDLPPVQNKPLTKKKFKKEIKKIKPKKPLKDHFNWREELDEDWQKVNRKDKTDGMSKAAVKAYRKENPGSKLKTAVTKDPKKLKKGSKSAKRRLAFCRRMKGMKKKLTSAKTSRDPNSRINKALRRWNC